MIIEILYVNTQWNSKSKNIDNITKLINQKIE